MPNRYKSDPKGHLFKEAPKPTRTPFDMNDGQSWLHAVANASGAHKVTRWQGEKSPVRVTTDGGSTAWVHRAGSEDEFFQQRDKMIAAFEEATGRAPNADSPTQDDLTFFESLGTLYDANADLGLDPDAVFGGLS
jgi:hypothetical protein